MTTPTPAVERAARALYEDGSMGESGRPPWERLRDKGSYHADVHLVLVAALNNPDDPDSLARTLYVLHWSVGGRETPAFALSKWDTAVEETREHWRAVADGLRTMLTGSGA